MDRPVALGPVTLRQRLSQIPREYKQGAAFLAVMVTLPLWVTGFWLYLVANSFVYAVAILSIVVLARATASLSLAQATFMGMAAYMCGWLVNQQGWPFALAALAGVVVAIPGGLLLAFPALRLPGLELAVLTLSVGLAGTAIIFSPGAPFAIGDGSGAQLGELPSIFGFDLDNTTKLYFALLVVAVAVFLGVMAVLAGPIGATWRAMRTGNAVASASGIRISRYQLLGFGMSAGLAGIAGVMLITSQNTVVAGTFEAGTSFYLVILAMVVGIDKVSSAAVGGFLLGFGQQTFPKFGIEGQWLELLTAFAVVAVVVVRERRDLATAAAAL